MTAQSSGKNAQSPSFDASQGVQGSFVLMLHSHLPFYRKAGMWPFGEENLYECMAETYLPLLNAVNELLAEGILAKITVGITPILAEQLADAHLQQGFIDYIHARLKAVEADLTQYPDPKVPHSEHLAYLASFYQKQFQQTLDDFTNRYERNLLAGFKKLQDAGAIEITTSAATHGFSPLLASDASLQAQYKTGVDAYQRHFGKPPRGCWLPECAYRPAMDVVDPLTGQVNRRPSIDAFLYQNQLQYFFTEYHAIEGGVTYGTRPLAGIYGSIQHIPLPARVPTGLSTYEAYWMKDYPVAVMGRNDRVSFQVWSAAHGYPGDGLYREFHKKDEQSGMHYWALTSKDCDLAHKMYYDPERAVNQTQSHADHFVHLVQEMIEQRRAEAGSEDAAHPLVMVSFDTELYGHWWFEGVEWLKRVIRGLHQNPVVQMQTAGEYLTQYPPVQSIGLPESTWGQGGHYWVWNNHHTEWMWPVIHQAERQMESLVVRFGEKPSPFQTRILNQALRELLLLQSSDWPFLVTTFQAKDYAVERFQGHVDRFNLLFDMLELKNADEVVLAEIEELDNAFPGIDYRWYHLEAIPQPQTTAVALTK